MIQKFITIVFKDVENENETKKVSVILRMNAIIMFLYFLCTAGIFFLSGEGISLALLIPCLCAYAVAFYITYLNATKFAAFFSVYITVCWICIFIRRFGWDCGIQHFIFVFVVLVFSISYHKLPWKIAMGTLACAFRLLLYAYTNRHAPICILGHRISVIYQICNTIFVFIGIMGILSVFTKDSMEMEQKLVQYNEKLHKLASLDPLTGLLNRRSMRECLEKRIKAYMDGHMESMALAIGDIDFFKKINDTYGHNVGDIVLKEFVKRIEHCKRDTDLCCRLGGEEFIVLMPSVIEEFISKIDERFRRQLTEKEIDFPGGSLSFTYSAGITSFTPHKGFSEDDLTDIINFADQLLYEAKRSGRARSIIQNYH